MNARHEEAAQIAAEFTSSEYIPARYLFFPWHPRLAGPSRPVCDALSTVDDGDIFI